MLPSRKLLNDWLARCALKGLGPMNLQHQQQTRHRHGHYTVTKIQSQVSPPPQTRTLWGTIHMYQARVRIWMHRNPPPPPVGGSTYQGQGTWQCWVDGILASYAELRARKADEQPWGVGKRPPGMGRFLRVGHLDRWVRRLWRWLWLQPAHRDGLRHVPATPCPASH